MDYEEGEHGGGVSLEGKHGYCANPKMARLVAEDVRCDKFLCTRNLLACA
jgi:hypothetical protein